MLAPLHSALFTAIADATSNAGSVMVILAVSVHPLASVAVTVYVPAVRLVIVLVVAPLDQANVYPVVPPDAEAVASPSFPALQLTLLP